MTVTFWDKRAEKYDEDIRRHDALYERTVEAMTKLLRSSDVVLDLGCGSGEFAIELASSVGSIHAVDTSSRMVDLARGKARDQDLRNIEFETADVLDPLLDGRSYSAAVTLNVLHLVTDVPGTLARLRSFLPADGLLISLTPCLGERGWLFRKLIGLLQALGIAPGIHELMASKLESSVRDSGFRIIESATWDEKTATRWLVARVA